MRRIGQPGLLKRVWVLRSHISKNSDAGSTDLPVLSVKSDGQRNTDQVHQLDVVCSGCGERAGSFVYDPDRGPTPSSGARLWFETDADVYEVDHPRTESPSSASP